MITDKVLLAVTPKAKNVTALVKAMQKYCAEEKINTPLREAHFLAQMAHESGGFIYDHEIWGPTPAQRKYEGRVDLGNTELGDGKLYAGRGLIQLTGRANYAKYGKALGLSLEDKPELASTPEVSVRIACAYWADHLMNMWADKDDIITITRKINGGLNGLEDRRTYLAKAKKALGVHA